MQIGVPWWIGAGPPEQGIEQAAALGADFVELSLDAPWPEGLDPAVLREATEEAGVGLGVHGPWRTQALAHPREPLARAAREVAQSCLDLARRAGARYIVFHVDARNFARYPADEAVQDGLETAHASLRALSAGAGEVEVVVENTSSPLGTPGEVAGFVDPLPEVGVCLDPGHAALAAHADVEGATADPDRWIEHVGDRLELLHVMDWVQEEGIVDHLVPGAGEADWPAFVDAARSAGCQRVLVEAFYASPDRAPVEPEDLRTGIERVREQA